MTELRIRAKYVAVVHASGRDVAERWRAQYQRGDNWTGTVSGSSKDVYDRLIALGENPDIEKVADIIGNKSWSFIHCDGCGENVRRAVSMGEYEPKNYCETCIAEATIILADKP